MNTRTVWKVRDQIFASAFVNIRAFISQKMSNKRRALIVVVDFDVTDFFLVKSRSKRKLTKFQNNQTLIKNLIVLET